MTRVRSIGLLLAALLLSGACRSTTPGVREGDSGASGFGGAAAGGAAPEGGVEPNKAVVLLFLVDGLQTAAVQTAVAAGAKNLELMIEGGVTVDVVHPTSPAARLVLPDDSQPWGNATSGNVAVHTGCHLFESRQMDDIFLAAHAAGIKSVFAGGDANYASFTNADFHYAASVDDEIMVQHAIDHFKNDGSRLLRLHLQRIRDSWTGPTDETIATSAYIQHLMVVDGLLGQLIQTFKDGGVWESTYIVVTSDHGMGNAMTSTHIPAQASSWNNFMAFYGPGIKKGATIPYAELPDVALMTVQFLGLPPLMGHTDPAVSLARKGTTGTFLSNIFEGAPRDLAHPKYIERYLQMGTFPNSADNYAPYRQAMLQIIK